jgi:ribitol 2-dehydrogenase
MASLEDDMGESLSGKIALVTGASSGIGRALARMLVREGATVVLAARSAEKLEALAAELGNDRASAIAVDLTRSSETERMVAEASDRHGRIDILLANAGIYVPGDIVENDPADWDQMISLNVNSVFRSVRAVLSGMSEQGSGDIVVTSSISGHQALHWEPVYSATKHAVQSFVHGVRRQAAPHGVRVGEISPGVVLNELWGYNDQAAIDAKVATREGIRSEDVADAVQFMLTRPPNVTIRDLVILPQNQDI